VVKEVPAKFLPPGAGVMRPLVTLPSEISLESNDDQWASVHLKGWNTVNDQLVSNITHIVEEVRRRKREDKAAMKEKARKQKEGKWHKAGTHGGRQRYRCSKCNYKTIVDEVIRGPCPVCQ
jgi:rubrerythrin